MGKNKTYLLAGVLVVLIFIAYLLVGGDEKRTSTSDFEEKIYEFDSVKVDKLDFVQNNEMFTIAKVGGIWKLTSPVDYPVNQEFIGGVLSNLKNYKIISLVSKNPDNKKKFGLDDSARVMVTVYQEGSPVGTLEIGVASTAPSQSYLKTPDSDAIYLANNLLRNNFVRGDGSNGWRTMEITAIPPGSVSSLEFISPSESFKVERDSIGRFVSGTTPADSTTVNGILNLLSAFNTQSFKDTVLGEDTNFDNTIIVNSSPTPVRLDFLKQGDSTNVNYLLKVSGTNQIFQFNQGLANNILKTKSQVLGQN